MMTQKSSPNSTIICRHPPQGAAHLSGMSLEGGRGGGRGGGGREEGEGEGEGEGGGEGGGEGEERGREKEGG